MGIQRWRDTEAAVRTCRDYPGQFLENLAMWERQRREQAAPPERPQESRYTRDYLKYRGRM